MVTLDELTEEIAERFDLGPKAPALVQEVLGLISAPPGGIGGLLDKVKAAGLEDKAASWLDSSYPMALSVLEVKSVLSTEDIKTIAVNTGEREDFVCKILGYAIPKLIGLLAGDGSIPEAIPAQLSSPPRGEDLLFGREEHFPMRELQGGGIVAMGYRLAIPGVALLITLGLLGYTISSGTSSDSANFQSGPSVGVAQNTPGTPSPPTPSQPWQPATGYVTAAISGTNTTATPASAQKPVLRAGETTRDFDVKSGWVQNLKAAVGGNGTLRMFADQGFYEVATVAGTNRAWRIGSLWPVQTPQFVVAALTGSGAAHINVTPSTLALGSIGTSAAHVIVVQNTPVTASPPPPIMGDFALASGWVQNLRAALGGFGGENSQTVVSQTLFSGNGFYEDATGATANHGAWQVASLWPAQLPQFAVAALTGVDAAPVSVVPSTLALGSGDNESGELPKTNMLDFPIIIFAPDSATVPSRSIALLRRAAEQIKQLPAGSAVQINGYTQGAARPAFNAELSQKRADAVHRILVHEGVSPALLSAKGYGSSLSLASRNGVTEGRSSKMTGEAGRQPNDRRVEFRVVQQGP